MGPEVYDFAQQHVRPLSAHFITADMVEIMDGEGNVVQKPPPQQSLRLTVWKIVYDLLKEALLESGDGKLVATYRTRRVVRDVEQVGEKMSVTVLDLETDTTTAMDGDLVIAADGAHSSIRRKLCPGVVPKYAGYVTWRGRVAESALPSKTREVLRDRCAILRVEGGYQLS